MLQQILILGTQVYFQKCFRSLFRHLPSKKENRLVLQEQKRETAHLGACIRNENSKKTVFPAICIYSIADHISC